MAYHHKEDREQRFKKLFDTCYTRLYYVALAIVKEADVAEDMVEEAFTHVWETRLSYDTMCQVSYFYLLSMVHNACHDYLRHSNVHQRYADFYIKAHSEGIMANDNERDERMAIIERVRKAMPEKTRRIMDLCYYENKKYDEVAEIVGLTKNGVRKQIMKGLKMMREAFSVNKQKNNTPRRYL